MADPVYPRKEPVAVGVDVGSTTVKAVVVDPRTKEILWSDYQRHQTKQPEKVLELIEVIEKTFPDSPRSEWRVFMTGSGAAPLCATVGAKFGTAMLWLAPPMLPLMVTVVYLSSRLGQVAGKGLFDVIRDHYPRWILRLAAV